MTEEKIGALWRKSGSKGEFWTGNIEINGEKIAVVVFPNDKGDNDKRPDFRILKARPKTQTAAIADNDW